MKNLLLPLFIFSLLLSCTEESVQPEFDFDIEYNAAKWPNADGDYNELIIVSLDTSYKASQMKVNNVLCPWTWCYFQGRQYRSIHINGRDILLVNLCIEQSDICKTKKWIR